MAWRQWLLKLSNSVWLVAVGLLLLLAVYVALGRNLIPWVAHYGEDVEAYLEGALGVPVEVGAVRGSWDGFDPILRIQDVRLLPPERKADDPTAFRLREFRLRLNVWASLRRQKLVFNDVYVVGIDAWLKQSADGRWGVQGVELGQSDSGADWDSLRRYLDQPNVSVAEVSLTLESDEGERSLWQLPRVHMRDLGAGYEASGTLLQPGAEERFLQFSLQGQGNPFKGNFTGLIYADWRSGPFLDPFLQAYRIADVRISHVDARGRTWLSFAGGTLRQAAGHLQLETLQWENNHLSIAPIEDLSVRFRTQFGDAGWQVWADQFEFNWRGQRWKPSALKLAEQARPDHPDQRELYAQVDRVPVGLLSELSQATHLLPVLGVSELAGRRPSGELRNLALRVPLYEGSRDLFDLRANLHDVNVRAYWGAPGVNSLDGYLALDQREGVVEFKADNLGLEFPNLYHQGWQFQQGQGVVTWQRLQHATEVEGHGLQVRLPDGQGELRGGFHLLLGDKSHQDLIENHFSLSLGARGVDALQAKAFVPCRIVTKAICDWVNDNVRGGTITEGSYLYNGSIERNASPDSFVSRLFLQVDDSSLAFHPDWPLAEQVSATLLLDGSALDVAVKQAVVAETPLSDARVWIPPLSAEASESAPARAVHVALAAPLSDDRMDYWLRQSPLREQTGDWMRDWSLDGNYQAEVNLEVPLAEQPLRARVKVSTEGGTLTVPDVPLKLTRLRGSLAYDTHRGLMAEGLRAEHLGRPLRVNVSSPIWRAASGAQPAHKTVLVQADGSLALTDLFRWRQIEPIPGLQGVASYRAGVRFDADAEGTRTTLDLASDLEGIRSDWPDPLRKDAQEKMPLRYIQQVQPDGSSQARLALGELLNGKLWFDGGAYRRGVLAFNSKDLESDFDGTLIRGELARVDADAWQSFIDKALGSHLAKDAAPVATEAVMGPPAPTGAVAGASESVGNETSDAPGGTPAVRLDLAVGRLQLLERELDQVRFVMNREEAGWRISLRNDSQIAGTLLVPDQTDAPLTARFDFLRLPAGTGEPGKPGEFDESQLSPLNIPLLDLSINNLMVGEQDYGAWSFVTERRSDGTVFKDLVGRIADARIAGRLSWLRDPVSGQQTTILTGTLKGGAVESLLETLGKTSSVTSKRMEFDVGLVWPAAPTEFEIAKASGSIAFKMEDGAFRDTTRSADAVRIFGVLNMESVMRRLRLDFSDLYGKGLSYDLMEGKASLSYGVMEFEQPLAIKGPSSAYKITGQADLNEERLDMEMVAILPVTKNLPLAAVLVGAPQVGGALFLIDRLLGDPLSRLTSVTYRLNGTFDEPSVEVKNVFDTRSEPKVSERP